MRRCAFLLVALLVVALRTASAAPRPVRTEFDRVKLDVRRKARNKESRVRDDLATPAGEQGSHGHTNTALHRRSMANMAGQASAAAVAGASELPESSLAPWTAPYTGVAIEARDSYDFANVMLRNDSLVFYQSSTAGDEEEPLPPALRLSRYEQQIDFPVHVYTSANMSEAPVCTRWAERPGVLFADPGWLNNFNEFFATTLMPLFQTATMAGLLQPGHMQDLLAVENSRFSSNYDVARDKLLEQLFSRVHHGAFQLISARPSFYASPWSYHVKFLTADTALLSDVQDGVCYKRLVVSEDAALRYLYERKHEMQDAGYRAYRADWLARFQQHLFGAEKLQAMVDHVYDYVSDRGRNATRTPQLVYISRSLASRRAVLNEAELLDYIRRTWDVTVVSTSFAMPLRDAITLMQDTDVLMGMHGAGLTNAFWMRPGSVMLQLFPYGWQLDSGEIIRTGLSRDIPLGLNGSYCQWVNPVASNAFFQEHSFQRAHSRWHDGWGTKQEFVAQPTPTLPLPKDWDPPEYWVYQDTKVDIESIAPVLEEALQAAGAKRWVPAAVQQRR